MRPGGSFNISWEPPFKAVPSASERGGWGRGEGRRKWGYKHPLTCTFHCFRFTIISWKHWSQGGQVIFISVLQLYLFNGSSTKNTDRQYWSCDKWKWDLLLLIWFSALSYFQQMTQNNKWQKIANDTKLQMTQNYKWHKMTNDTKGQMIQKDKWLKNNEWQMTQIDNFLWLTIDEYHKMTNVKWNKMTIDTKWQMMNNIK